MIGTSTVKEKFTMAETGGIPETGDRAPAFTGQDGDGQTVRLSQYKGRYVVLYFYPKDNTPGCTVEAREFRDARDEFDAANAVVIGVSPDSVGSHCKFSARFELNFPLIADEDHRIANKYGVWVEKSMYGKTFMGVQRATFLIDTRGKIAHVWPKVRPAGHAEAVLAVLQELAL